MQSISCRKEIIHPPRKQDCMVHMAIHPLKILSQPKISAELVKTTQGLTSGNLIAYLPRLYNQQRSRIRTVCIFALTIRDPLKGKKNYFLASKGINDKFETSSPDVEMHFLWSNGSRKFLAFQGFCHFYETF